MRVSGSIVPVVARAILGRLPPPREATHAKFLAADGMEIDSGLAIFFAAPKSFTGEPVLELQCHGGVAVSGLLLARVLELGARRASAGEFTLRAYLNGKLDLAQAEAVADLVNAESADAARAAVRSLEGEFSRAVHGLESGLLELRTWVEAAIDFPVEEIDFLADRELARRLAQLRADFAALIARAREGRALNEGLTVVIAGAPNAGKSTLLNSLAGVEAAIVTATPGTTRDVLRERILIDGLPLRLVDTAGLRATADEIEAEGVRRARNELLRADRVLFLVDASADPEARSFASERAALPANVPVTLVWSKSDLVGAGAGAGARANAGVLPAGAGAALPAGASASLAISAKTGAGLDALRAHLKECAGLRGSEAGALSARARHLEALALARDHLEAAAALLAGRRAGELVAEELRLARRALEAITGEAAEEELLDRIFAGFCIGK